MWNSLHVIFIHSPLSLKLNGFFAHFLYKELNSKADGECCTCTTTSTTESSRSKGRNENEILEIVIRPQPNQSFFNNENDVSRIPNANMDQELGKTTIGYRISIDESRILKIRIFPLFFQCLKITQFLVVVIFN